MNSWSFLIALFALTFLAALSYACPALTSVETASTETEAINVNIKLFTFKPGSLEVPPGTTVVWTNGDAIEHSVTSGTPDQPGEAFDSGLFNKGDSFSFNFTEPGEYPYFCRKHDFMRGNVKVGPGK